MLGALRLPAAFSLRCRASTYRTQPPVSTPGVLQSQFYVFPATSQAPKFGRLNLTLATAYVQPIIDEAITIATRAFKETLANNT